MQPSPSHAEETLTLRRVIRASQEKTFDAWMNPEHLQHWWRAKESLQTAITEVDLRQGGKYRLGMHDPETGKTHVCFGEFREVSPPHKLVYTWSWEPPGMEVGETLVTVEFLARGDDTELILTHKNFPHAEARESHAMGWNGCLDIFSKYVQG